MVGAAIGCGLMGGEKVGRGEVDVRNDHTTSEHVKKWIGRDSRMNIQD